MTTYFQQADLAFLHDADHCPAFILEYPVRLSTVVQYLMYAPDIVPLLLGKCDGDAEDIAEITLIAQKIVDDMLVQIDYANTLLFGLTLESCEIMRAWAAKQQMRQVLERKR